MTEAHIGITVADWQPVTGARNRFVDLHQRQGRDVGMDSFPSWLELDPDLPVLFERQVERVRGQSGLNSMHAVRLMYSRVECVEWLRMPTRAGRLSEGFVHTEFITRHIEAIAISESDETVPADERRLAHDTLRRSSNGVLIAVAITQFIGFVAETRILHPVLAVIVTVVCVFFLAMSRHMRRDLRAIILTRRTASGALRIDAVTASSRG